MQAQAAGKLAHLFNSASGIYDVVNVCSSDEDDIEEEDGGSLQPPMQVVCDMDTKGGGWTVILRRKRTVITHINFNRKWDDYENGFGNLHTEFWIGLRNIHCLTTREEVDLMIDLRDNNGNGMTWIYHDFKVNGSNDKYRLQIGQGEGPPGGYDAMANHNGKQFSTLDSDNDGNSGNCADVYDAGWWHGPDCHGGGALLTGYHTDTVQWARLLWYLGQGSGPANHKYYHNVEMKTRPKSCTALCEKP